MIRPPHGVNRPSFSSHQLGHLFSAPTKGKQYAEATQFSSFGPFWDWFRVERRGFAKRNGRIAKKIEIGCGVGAADGK
jgi:hypothetical protein